MEHYEHGGSNDGGFGKKEAPAMPLPGTVVARNTRFTCTHCGRGPDRAAMEAWWTARVAQKPYADRARHLTAEGNCANCANRDGRFESHNP
jgi:hypothetical protein